MSGAVRIAHSSDIHVGLNARGGEGAAGLRRVLATARAEGADLLILAGDTFESHQIPQAAIERTGRLLAEAVMPVVILPGNHDPALPDSVYRRGRFERIATLSILGVTHEEAVIFPEFDLEIWGYAHLDYDDMRPLRGPRPRRTARQIAVAHGHYEPPETRERPLRPSWVFGDEEIAATAADYLALGHWDRPAAVGDGTVPAFYSGSPDLAGTINLVRLDSAGRAQVSRVPLVEG